MKKIVISLLIIIVAFTAKAQRHHEIGILGGVDYYMGDLAPTNVFRMPGYNFGIIYRYSINPRIALRVLGHYGYLQGDSKLNTPNLQYKNLDFHTALVEFEMGIEINFLEYIAGSDKHRFTPFVFAGVSVFHFNPKTWYMGKEYELQPLGTEGQGLTAYPDRKPYALTSIAIPFGFGIKWSVSQTVSIGLEWGLRKTFTDYLDDVSTTYPDPALLSAEKSPLAAVLSDRQYEQAAIANGLDISMDPNGQPHNPTDYKTYLQDYLMKSTGAQRGGEAKDWFSVAGITVVFKIKGPRQKSCPAYQKHSKYKEYLLF